MMFYWSLIWTALHCINQNVPFILKFENIFEGRLEIVVQLHQTSQVNDQ